MFKLLYCIILAIAEFLADIEVEETEDRYACYMDVTAGPVKIHLMPYCYVLDWVSATIQYKNVGLTVNAGKERCDRAIYLFREKRKVHTTEEL